MIKNNPENSKITKKTSKPYSEQDNPENSNMTKLTPEIP
jgi:hypothetical protein